MPRATGVQGLRFSLLQHLVEPQIQPAFFVALEEHASRPARSAPRVAAGQHGPAWAGMDQVAERLIALVCKVTKGEQL